MTQLQRLHGRSACRKGEQRRPLLLPPRWPWQKERRLLRAATRVCFARLRFVLVLAPSLLPSALSMLQMRATWLWEMVDDGCCCSGTVAQSEPRRMRRKEKLLRAGRSAQPAASPLLPQFTTRTCVDPISSYSQVATCAAAAATSPQREPAAPLRRRAAAAKPLIGPRDMRVRRAVTAKGATPFT
jgi:hypothetical protein